MSETTPDSETTESAARPHLQPVPDEAPKAIPAHAGPVRQSGGHLTGLLALLLAVAVFALIAQFSAGRALEAENQELRGALAATQAELDSTRAQMTEARDALGGLRDVLVRIEGLLAPPAAAPAAEAPVEAAPNAE